MEIAAEIPNFSTSLDIKFASYATGWETFRKAGRPSINLDLPEANPFLPTFFKAKELIEEIHPDIVISHEEFAAVPAAHMGKTPSIFISAWLPKSGSIFAHALEYASSAIIFEHPGIFPVNELGIPNISFLGPLHRKMQYTRDDRRRAREELSIAENATCILVISGGWATEEKAPVAHIVFPMFKNLNGSGNVLYWVTSDDDPRLSAKAENLPGVLFIPYRTTIDQLMVASDLIISKGTRGTTIDAAHLGTPSISLSYGLNPIDDLLIGRIRSNLALNAYAVDAAVLEAAVRKIVSVPFPLRPAIPPLESRPYSAAAKALVDEIHRLLPHLPVR
jgi:hypothetical protein